MSEIPEDVFEAARVLNMKLHSATELGQRTQWIAEALLAERGRKDEESLWRFWNAKAIDLSERLAGQWQPIDTAPQDGTIINVVGRYKYATAGHPRYAGFRNGEWFEYSRFEPQRLVCWAWRPRGDWPQEGRI